MSLYRKMTPAEVLAAQAGVTDEGVTHGGVTQVRRAAGAEPRARPVQVQRKGPSVPPAVAPEATEAKSRKGDRHKEGQAAYMRKWRAEQKLKKQGGAGRGT